MPKEQANFRIEGEALEQIRRLSRRWNVSQGRMIELLVEEAIRENRELRAIPGEALRENREEEK